MFNGYIRLPEGISVYKWYQCLTHLQVEQFHPITRHWDRKMEGQPAAMIVHWFKSLGDSSTHYPILTQIIAIKIGYPLANKETIEHGTFIVYLPLNHGDFPLPESHVAHSPEGMFEPTAEVPRLLHQTIKAWNFPGFAELPWSKTWIILHVHQQVTL